MAQIHELIGKAMGKIGAIGKTSKNAQQGFMYRGIDAVYNELNPVMSELGLFICPEVLDMKREERTNAKGTVIIYTALTIRYTVYAPDGSNVQLTVVGEGMDTGDKSVNKAMSITMKYAMFQLFFIATEDLKDPDSETFTDIKPTTAPVKAPITTATVATVTTEAKLPTPSPVKQFLLTAMAGFRQKRNISAAANEKIFKDQCKALIAAKMAPDKSLEDYTMDEAASLIEAMDKCFDLMGTELKVG